MKTALALLTITLALAGSGVAQTASQADTARIESTCTQVGAMVLPVVKLASELGTDTRYTPAFRLAMEKRIRTLSRLAMNVCESKTLPEQKHAVAVLTEYTKHEAGK
jgi:hypothetical protein